METKTEQTETTAVATLPKNEGAVAQVDDVLEMLAANAGEGKEDCKASDYNQPYLAILEKNSPQADEMHDKYVKGAKQGMIFNTLTRDLYDGLKTGVTFVVAHYAHVYGEWVPRAQGGGFVGVHPDTTPILKKCTLVADSQNPKKKILRTPEGNDFIETAIYHGILVLDDGSTQPAVISMTGSRLGSSRNWNTLRDGSFLMVNGKKVEAPTYAYEWNLKTLNKKKNDNSWFVWDVTRGNVVRSAKIVKQAQELREAIKNGLIRTVPMVDEVVDEGDEKVPF